MKRKSKKAPFQSNALKPSIKKHLKALGLTSDSQYFAWCHQRNFDQSLDKSREEIQEEYAAYRDERLMRKENTRVHHNPERFLEESCMGKIDPQTIRRSGWHEIAQALAKTSGGKEHRKHLARFLLQLNKKAKFVFEEAAFGTRKYLYIQALINLHSYKNLWIRHVDDWTPETHNVHGQFSSLLHHLLAQYTVPEFMSSAWFRTDEISKDYRDWYIHVANGQNIRTASLPLPFTRKMAHWFMQAPDHCSIENAIKWGHIIALGGDERLVEEVLTTRIAECMDNYDFWVSVYRFFIDNPMLDRSHVGPIIDFLYTQKFEVQECVTGPGIIEYIQPPQPNLCMKGRTAESLISQVERWHGQLSKSSAALKLFFKKSGIPEYRQKTGDRKENIWSIRELLSGAELVQEGREMKHCVASYARACAEGNCSIWTLEYTRANVVEKCQTIEVRSDKNIVQVRGKGNRYPTQSELGIIRNWAQTAGLSVSPYVRSK
ncbi:MAG: hypothetical protein EA357_11275 [Micavibrio sp.]|nr:MAG: hypothetical protein EA357_11275 [Micavibrio sp.]